ncbi:MAG: DUF480 domain-containing protein [Planctomycetes bacterium]|nr:DUF480 domain-containing protein [Planctomycetota bacterium]
MADLDPTGQRIVGVLIEKQLSVPDSYPLTENSLLAGCNQSSNRDPVGEYESFQIAGALMALHEQNWVARVEGAGRVPKYRHRADERLGADPKVLAVMAELLLRGPQAPGALKPRVARMGYHAEPAAIEALLRGLAEQRPPLVEQLPLGPRERDRRWRHLLGPRAESSVPRASAAPQPAPAPAAATAAPPDLASRVEALEAEVAALRRRLDELGA